MLKTPSEPDPVRILLVDDSQDMCSCLRSLVSASFGGLRCEVVAEAPTGLAGIYAAGSERPDLVILDGEMPVMDGLAALPHILEAAPWARVVFHSANTAEFEALGLGAVAFVRKGDVEMLGQVLERLAEDVFAHPGASREGRSRILAGCCGVLAGGLATG